MHSTFISNYFFFSSFQTDNDPWTAEDLQLQIDIVSRVEGVDAAMLKLRLPYTSGATELPKGRIMLPVWGGQTSTETRLVVAPPFTMTRYEHKTYEEQLFHFNTSTRLKTYPEYAPAHSDHPRHKTAVKGIGYDWRYDTTREIAILDAYVRQVWSIACFLIFCIMLYLDGALIQFAPQQYINLLYGSLYYVTSLFFLSGWDVIFHLQK